MVSNRFETSEPAGESSRAGAERQSAAPVPKRNGNAVPGKTWAPLLANIILMPAIAYGLTTYLLIPRIHEAKVVAAAAATRAANGQSLADAASSNSGAALKGKFVAPLTGKILVNVAGTAGTRYLVASITLVGKNAEFKELVDHNDPQLRDSASSILSGKTIGDLEKPGMRNILRAELISAFNDVLGKETVSDIYLTEFAVQ